MAVDTGGDYYPSGANLRNETAKELIGHMLAGIFASDPRDAEGNRVWPDADEIVDFAYEIADKLIAKKNADEV